MPDIDMEDKEMDVDSKKFKLTGGVNASAAEFDYTGDILGRVILRDQNGKTLQSNFETLTKG